MPNYVVDTHALLWYLTDSQQISRPAKAIFRAAESGRATIIISIIVLLETLDILEKKKVAFDFDVLLNKITKSDAYLIQDLDMPLLAKLKEIKVGLELHDRVIVASAKIWSAKIVTKDNLIHQEFPDMAIWWFALW